MPDEKSAPQERLQVALARHGIASRRGVVSMIEEGRVKVNDVVVREKGFRVDSLKDTISVDGQPLTPEVSRHKEYFIFNKPKGVMTTLQDPHAERTVADFFKDIPVRLFPVGRLDRDTTGLLIMTNDGELTFRLTHPKFGVKKKYRAVVEGAVTKDEAIRLEKGVLLEEGMTAPCQVEILAVESKESVLMVTLHEGKKRQIRRIFEKIGHWVKTLERLYYGPIALDDLRLGAKRELTSHEITLLKEATGLVKAARAPRSPRKRSLPEGGSRDKMPRRRYTKKNA